MGYRIGNFYYKQSDDWRGYNVFEDGIDEPVSWLDSSAAAASECKSRHIAALEKQLKDVKAENVKLANQVDDMQHDIGVFAFCGLFMNKDDVESLRSEDMIPLLEMIGVERERRINMQIEVSHFSGELVSLLHYVKVGQYGDGEDVDIHSEVGLELFNAVRGLMADAIAGSFLADEVKRLDEREQRFVKHCDALSKLMGELLKFDTGALASTILQALEDSGGILDISVMLNPCTDWYHYTEAQVLDMLSKADITESGAAYLLDTHIIDVRVRMEQAYGANWRDIPAD